jgi:hypothetical protein
LAIFNLQELEPMSTAAKVGIVSRQVSTFEKFNLSGQDTRPGGPHAAPPNAATNQHNKWKQG